MINTFTVVTTPHPDGTIEQSIYSNIARRREEILRQVIFTQDQQVRDALIALGWTPPKEG